MNEDTVLTLGNDGFKFNLSVFLIIRSTASPARFVFYLFLVCVWSVTLISSAQLSRFSSLYYTLLYSTLLLSPRCHANLTASGSNSPHSPRCPPLLPPLPLVLLLPFHPLVLLHSSRLILYYRLCSPLITPPLHLLLLPPLPLFLSRLHSYLLLALLVTHWFLIWFRLQKFCFSEFSLY